MLVAVVIVGFIAPWSNGSVSLVDKVLFGLVAALAATLGDLCESVIKRDLGVKDMGTLLPGPRRHPRPLRRPPVRAPRHLLRRPDPGFLTPLPMLDAIWGQSARIDPEFGERAGK